MKINIVINTQVIHFLLLFFKKNYYFLSKNSWNFTESKGMNIFQAFHNILPEILNQSVFPRAVYESAYHPAPFNIKNWNLKKRLCYSIGKMLTHFCFNFYCLLQMSWTSKISIRHMHSASVHFLFISFAHLEGTLKANSHNLWKIEQGLPLPFNFFFFPLLHLLTADLTLISEH